MSQQSGVTVCDRTLRVRGEIDMEVTSTLTDSIVGLAETIAHHTVVVDLSWTTFIDPMGVGALIEARNRLAGMGKELALQNVPESVQRVFVLTGVGEHLNVRSVRR